MQDVPEQIWCLSMLQLLVNGRNALWLGNSEKPGLLQTIQKTEKPICIAVGCGHLFGPQGLLERLKEEDPSLHIERVSLQNDQLIVKYTADSIKIIENYENQAG